MTRLPATELLPLEGLTAILITPTGRPESTTPLSDERDAGWRLRLPKA